MSTKKGKKRIKNVPVLHNELKKRHGVLLTDTAWEALKKKAKEDGISISEMIEAWAKKMHGE